MMLGAAIEEALALPIVWSEEGSPCPTLDSRVGTGLSLDRRGAAVTKFEEARMGARSTVPSRT